MERWADIEGYEGSYQVSDKGNVRSKDRYTKTWNGQVFKKGVIKTLKYDKHGYLKVTLSKKSKKRNFFVHRLVAAAFIANESNLPVVNHLNNVKDDNRVSNLEWTTVSGNTKHAFDNGFREPHCGNTSIKVSCEDKDGKVTYHDSISSLEREKGVKKGKAHYYVNKEILLEGKYSIKKVADEGVETSR